MGLLYVILYFGQMLSMHLSYSKIIKSMLSMGLLKIIRLMLSMHLKYKAHSKHTLKIIMSMLSTLQMKSWWQSNINVWFLFMYSQKWNCAASLFPRENYNVQSTIFPGSFCCSQICGQILGIYNLLTGTCM